MCYNGYLLSNNANDITKLAEGLISTNEAFLDKEGNSEALIDFSTNVVRRVSVYTGPIPSQTVLTTIKEEAVNLLTADNPKS